MSEQNPSRSGSSPSGIPTPPARAPGRPGSGNLTRWIWVAGLVLAAAGVGAWMLTRGPEESAGPGPTAKVVRGPLLVTLAEKAQIDAGEKLIIANALRRPVVIKEVAPQGPIAKGALVVEFECKELFDALDDAELEVLKQANLLEDALQNRAIKDKELSFEITKAQVALKDALGEIERYKQDQRIKFDEAASGVKLADQEVKLAQEKLDAKLDVNRTEKLKDSYSKNEINNDRLKVDQLRVAAEKARAALDMLRQFDHPKKLRELQTALEQANLGVERADLTRKAQMAIADNLVETNQKNHAQRIRRRDDLKAEKKQLRFEAPRDGLVVYDTGDNRRYRTSDVDIRVGEPVRPLQQLMVIPDLTSLQAKLTVHEAVVRHIREGLPATIRLDTEPEKPLRGHISHVSSLAESQDFWINRDVKVFNVVVEFEPEVDISKIKPGTSAKVEMVLARLDDVLSVPVAAVYARQDKYYCRRVASDGQVQPVAVAVGLTNERRIEITSGLAEDDVVLLTPPKLTEKERRDAAQKDPTSQPAGGRPPTPASRPARKPGDPTGHGVPTATARPAASRPAHVTRPGAGG